jgi:endonuclease YncB( thermonuclease family)
VLTIVGSAVLTAGALLILGGETRDDSQPPAVASNSTVITGRASIIDGDTLDVGGQRIRLHGIDAPESRQTCRDATGRDYRCGQRATLALSDKVGGQLVSCERRDVDRYNRIVAVCRLAGEDLNAWLVSEGWAVAYRRYSGDYIGAEQAAKSTNRGLWAGTFTPPDEWRHRADTALAKAQPSKAAQPISCAIKGNISSSGERIYHVPGGEYYDATRINPAKGERMFCTEAAARAAGWRRSKR